MARPGSWRMGLRSRPSTADLTVAVGPGALLANGRINGTVRIADASGGARARVDLTAENALLYTSNLSIAAARITADGPLANLPLSIQARGEAHPGRWRIDVNGRLTEDAGGQALSLEGRSRVLEIGTGSGYQTAVLSRIARYVYTIERYRTLLGEAEARLRRLATTAALGALALAWWLAPPRHR